MAHTPSAATAKEGWHAVDEVLAELDRLAAADLTDDAFYSDLFARLGSLGCSAAAIWDVHAPESPRLVWHAPHQQSQNGHGFSTDSNQAAVVATTQGGEPRLFEAAKAGEKAGGPTNGPFVVVPWRRTSGAQGALQVWLQGAARPGTAEGYLRLFAAVGEVVNAFFVRQDQRRMRRQLERHGRIDAFNTSLHESLDLDQTAYRIANDGRLVLGCDRLAVAVRRGGHYKIIAVSGAEHIHRRSESVHQLQRLIDGVVASSQPFWHDGQPQDFPPQLASALADYLDLSPALSLAIVPLTAPSSEKDATAKPVGVLVFEQYSQPFDNAARDQIEAILAHCRLALTNALRLQTIPAHRFWLSLGRDGWLPAWASRTAIALTILAAIILALVLIPADVWIKARGELQPTVRSEVFAPRDGIVTTVHVGHGQHVKEGDKLLEMRSSELDLELQRVQGELETTRKRLAAAQSERLQTKPGDADARLRQRRLSAEEEQLQQQVASLELRQQMLQRQLAELIVKSPVNGDVITWNVQQQLATRPLRRGDALLTIAQIDGPWQLELRLPSRRAGRLIAARAGGAGTQEVSFMLTTDPGRALQGTIKHVAERVETDDSGDSYLLVTVEIPNDRIPRRVPGATAIAKIHCSRASLAEALFHDLFDAALLWLPF